MHVAADHALAMRLIPSNTGSASVVPFLSLKSKRYPAAIMSQLALV
jgi:hypothetical protein